MRAWLKNASEIENDSSTSRSRWSSENGRRKSMNGNRNSTQSGTHTYSALTCLPNAPG